MSRHSKRRKQGQRRRQQQICRRSSAPDATPPTPNSATTTTTASLSPDTSASPAEGTGPKVVGCLFEHENKILLCKRNIQPSHGLWRVRKGHNRSIKFTERRRR
ncbi:hypothetical protein ACS0TY_007202 [Phlomoides rotata]